MKKDFLSIRLGTHNQKGFSLIELMVVVSIMSTLVAISLPVFYKFKIEAARVEMKFNTNAIYTLAKSFHSDQSFYPTSGSYGSSVIAGTRSYFCDSTVPSSLTTSMGFKTANCQKLRYSYYFYPYANFGHPAGSINDATRYFTIVAESSFKQFANGFSIGFGNPAINPICKNPYFTAFFEDKWIMTEDRIVSTFDNNDIYDMVKSCL